MPRERPVFLMCRPTFYGVEYEINPWMSVRRQPDRRLAMRQWEALRRAVREHLGADVRLCRARPGLPDMCFTANAGIVHGRTFIAGRFRHKERAGETPVLTAWFRRRGYAVLEPPPGHPLEGSGDAMRVGDLVVAGYLRRSDIQAHAFVGEVFRLPVLSLALTAPRFYHLDTCFAPLGGGGAAYYPGALDRYGLRALRGHFGDLVEVSDAEAERFACNLVAVGKRAIVAAGCPRLEGALRERGVSVRSLDFSEFIKAGGAARCLTLRLR